MHVSTTRLDNDVAFRCDVVDLLQSACDESRNLEFLNLPLGYCYVYPSEMEILGRRMGGACTTRWFVAQRLQRAPAFSMFQNAPAGHSDGRSHGK